MIKETDEGKFETIRSLNHSLTFSEAEKEFQRSIKDTKCYGGSEENRDIFECS
jgi:hypothetical protein